MERYVGYTLVDITVTNVTRVNVEKEKERNQQRNWETVLQCIGLRVQPMEIINSVLIKDIDFEFGDYVVDSNTKIWMFEFSVETDKVFVNAESEIGLLTDSFERVPFISGLDESIKFEFPIFVTAGKFKNIHFKIL